jgi:hypothetical protein
MSFDEVSTCELLLKISSQLNLDSQSIILGQQVVVASAELS